MRRAVLLAWVVGAVSAQAQTIYTWTDARGTVHYTDDPTTIPSNVKAKTTEGNELSDTGAPAPQPAPAPAAAPVVTASPPPDPRSEESYWRKEFRTLNVKIRDLEDELLVDVRRYEDPSRTPYGPSYNCPPGYFYNPGYIGRPYYPGYGTGQVVAGSVSGAVNVPLGNGATLGVAGSAGATAVQNTGVVTTTGVTPFAGYGYGYGYGYGGCYFAPTDDYVRMRERVDRTRLALARAKEDLADLERRAANASVPLEWRRDGLR